MSWPPEGSRWKRDTDGETVAAAPTVTDMAYLGGLGILGQGCLYLANTVSQIFPVFTLHDMFPKKTVLKKKSECYDRLGVAFGGREIGC
jgi:hypothetical protein